MDKKDGMKLKFLVVIILMVIIIAGYYILKPEDPIVLAQKGDIEITLELDKVIFDDETEYINGNVTITNIASDYRHIWRDPNHFRFYMINNSIEYHQIKERSSGIWENIKLEPDDSYTFSFQIERIYKFKNYTIQDSFDLYQIGEYGMFFYMSDFDTKSNVINIEILDDIPSV